MRYLSGPIWVSGTNAERLAMSATELGDYVWHFYETDTNAEYDWKGSEWTQGSVDGAKKVSVGAVGTSHNRNIDAASSTYPATDTTNNVTFTAGQVITEISITPLVTTTAGTSYLNDQACLVAFNLASNAAAAAAFANTGGVSTDVSYEIVRAGQTITRSFTEANPCIRIDVLPIGSGNTVMRVGIAAIGA